ncbi:hypothetical protein G5I_00520 [Acromyrmex echinatior]|uniref:Uncharacterized protein n=1 Tax=Acromyrmex echinatior TaxID=103372 RepID=F4W530_ACREC|nr:hypothetical protein G5I_00520 [Acromyrmex echinatior]
MLVVFQFHKHTKDLLLWRPKHWMLRKRNCKPVMKRKVSHYPSIEIFKKTRCCRIKSDPAKFFLNTPEIKNRTRSTSVSCIIHGTSKENKRNIETRTTYSAEVEVTLIIQSFEDFNAEASNLRSFEIQMSELSKQITSPRSVRTR